MAELKGTDPKFAAIETDCRSEFWDAVRLGDLETPDAGLAEITSRRTNSRPKPPEKAISIIHKAKGLECDSVIVMPCDARTFADKADARCLLSPDRKIVQRGERMFGPLVELNNGVWYEPHFES